MVFSSWRAQKPDGTMCTRVGARSVVFPSWSMRKPNGTICTTVRSVVISSCSVQRSAWNHVVSVWAVLHTCQSETCGDFELECSETRWNHVASVWAALHTCQSKICGAGSWRVQKQDGAVWQVSGQHFTLAGARSVVFSSWSVWKSYGAV